MSHLACCFQEVPHGYLSRCSVVAIASVPAPKHRSHTWRVPNPQLHPNSPPPHRLLPIGELRRRKSWCWLTHEVEIFFFVVVTIFNVLVFRFACVSVWGCVIPWNWSYKRVWAALWLLGIEPGPSRRAACALNSRPSMPPAPWSGILNSRGKEVGAVLLNPNCHLGD